MRRRKEIEGEVLESNAEGNGVDTVALLQLEVLLDIRDLLTDLYNRDCDVKVDYR